MSTSFEEANKLLSGPLPNISDGPISAVAKIGNVDMGKAYPSYSPPMLQSAFNALSNPQAALGLSLLALLTAAYIVKKQKKGK